jgi:S1-C subfamily serine protease
VGTVADIFISYASPDRERARLLADGLERHGWSAWWDREIQHGRAFDDAIEEALNAARCVIVLWSNASVRGPTGPGGLVIRLDPGPALKAGMHAGDVITRIREKPIAAEDDLRTSLLTLGPASAALR